MTYKYRKLGVSFSSFQTLGYSSELLRKRFPIYDILHYEYDCILKLNDYIILFLPVGLG